MIALSPATAVGPAHAEPTAAELEKQIETKSHDLEPVVEQYNKINEQLAETRAEITNRPTNPSPATPVRIPRASTASTAGAGRSSMPNHRSRRQGAGVPETPRGHWPASAATE